MPFSVGGTNLIELLEHSSLGHSCFIIFKIIWPSFSVMQSFKVPINPKYFFCLNKSLHLLETHCTFLNQVLTFFYVVKVTKSSHHLSHDRASKGMGLFLVWRQKLICIVLSLCKHACKQVCDVKQGVDPYPLLARSFDRWWPDFVTFTACKRSIFGFKKGKKAQCISNRCKDLFKRKNILGIWAL